LVVSKIGNGLVYIPALIQETKKRDGVNIIEHPLASCFDVRKSPGFSHGLVSSLYNGPKVVLAEW